MIDIADRRTRPARRCTTTCPTTPATTGATATRRRSTPRSPRRRTSPSSSFVNNRLMPERDGAARRQRRLQQARRELHALRRQPEPARRAAADVRLRARPAGIEGAGDRARRRRRLRLEDLPLSGGRRPGLGEQAGRPADQVDRRAQRVVPHRRARPRPRHHRRDGDGRAGQLPGAARQDDRQHGRLPVDLRLGGADDPLRDAARRPVQDAGDLRRGEGGVHQHRAGRRLPRRRAARGDLRRRAHRRAGGARDEDRSRPRSGAGTSSPASRTRRRSA